MKTLKVVVMIVTLASLTGCASIPQEAPELSSELGKRIAAIEESHIALLRRFMDEKRKQVDQFVKTEWTPKFAENYFKQPNVNKAWDETVKGNNPNDRLMLLTLVGPKLQEEINKKRLELIKPLDEIEKDIERRLRDEYRQAQAMNNSITSFLASAAKVAENRDRLLRAVGIEDAKIKKAISDADVAVQKLTDQTSESAGRFEEFKKSINEVKAELVK